MPALRFALAACAWASLTAGAIADPSVIATASSTSGSVAPTTSAATAADDTPAQISAWLHTNDDGSLQQSDSEGSAAPRAIHGEVGVGAGSNGFSTEYGVADIPLGKTSDLVVAGSNTDAHFRGRGGVQGQSLSVGLFLNGASPAQQPCNAAQGSGAEFGSAPQPPVGYGTGPLGYSRQHTGCAASPAE